MCAEFAERLTGQDLSYLDNQPVNYPASSPDAPFSSSREEKLTTAENPELEGLLRDPELGYWKDNIKAGSQNVGLSRRIARCMSTPPLHSPSLTPRLRQEAIATAASAVVL